MPKKTKKIIFYAGGIVIFVITICLLVFSYKKAESGIKSQHQKQPPGKPTIPLTEPLNNKIPSNEDVPSEREDINLQLTLGQRKRGARLSPVEEQKIIESLASRVNWRRSQKSALVKKIKFEMRRIVVVELMSKKIYKRRQIW